MSSKGKHWISPLKGKTYEEIYGIEKAKELKILRSNIVNNLNYWKNRRHQEIFENKCKFCQKIFISKGKKRIYCSMSCKARDNNPASKRKGKTLEELYGLEKSKSWRCNNSIALLGRKNKNPNGWGKGGYRKDLNSIWFRSTWEANVARILNHLNIKWEYETNRVFLETCSFLIDFWLPDLKINLEIKGSRFGNKDKKLELLYKMNPNFPIKIIDDEVYKKLSKMYRNKIVGWE